MLLVIVDIQEKLARHISGIDSIVANTRKLIKACKIFGIPILLTEQEKLGDTIEEIRELVDVEPIRKLTFSCMRNEKFYAEFKRINPRKCFLVGIEAHICILQTALDMLREGCEVYVVVDCIGSRREADKSVAVQRMVSEGAIPTTAESLIYEIMETAEHKRFKEILEIVKE